MAAALLAMARVLGGDGFGAADALLLLCFAAMLPWNALGFWNALVGLLILYGSRDPVGFVTPALRTPPSARSALGWRWSCRSTTRTRGGWSATSSTVASLDATGEAAGFEVFLLSDTRVPEIAAAEEALFRRWRSRALCPDRLHYRRRATNEGHKTGNLWDFLERHGERFDHMVVLDADSVMSGAAIAGSSGDGSAPRDRHPAAAHRRPAQPQPVPADLPVRHAARHARLHGRQRVVAGRLRPLLGPQRGDPRGSFMAHCRLPTLPGKPPLGGRVLSHDQVEAVLMRRAGWQVRVVADEDGSFEENPPTLSDFVKRDLRWCQSNWQYVHLVGMRAARDGRLQLWLAILMYVSGPAWMLFALVGFGRAIAAGVSPAVAANGAPVACARRLGSWALLAATMALVFAPKLAGVAQVLLFPGFGGTTAAARRSSPPPWSSCCSPSSSPRSWRSRRRSSCSA